MPLSSEHALWRSLRELLPARGTRGSLATAAGTGDTENSLSLSYSE